MIRKARFIDYFNLQGGVPTINQDENGLWHIKHDYREDEAHITTHISPTQRGTVIIGDVEYEVAKLFMFEGKPCETQSRMTGGEGYGRTR